MNYSDQSVTREQWEQSIPNGATVPFTQDCDYYFIDAIAVGAEGGAPSRLSLKINNSRNFAVCRAGQSQQGVPGLHQFKRLTFYNDTGATVFIRVIYGNGQCNFANIVTIQNATLEMGSTTINAIVDGIVDGLSTPETGELLIEDISNDTKVFSGHSGLEIVNTGAVDILIKTSRMPAGVVLPVGAQVGGNANGRFDLVGIVTVDCETTSGGAARVIQVGGAVADP